MLHIDDLLEQPPHFPVTLEEYTLEDFLVPPIMTCNMASVLHDEDPQPPKVTRPTIMPQELIILLDLFRNTLIYQDHSKRRTIPIAWFGYSNDSLSITLEDYINDAPFHPIRITCLPMAPWKRRYFHKVLDRFWWWAFPCHTTLYLEPFSPSYEVPLFDTFSNVGYQCPWCHLFKFMISFKK